LIKVLIKLYNYYFLY
jgi:large subunit ribosomal protein L10e